MYSSLAAAVLTLAIGATAQSTSVTSLFFGGPTISSQQWAASVVNVGTTDTTYQIVCTAGCPSASSITQSLTLGPSNLDYAFSTEISGNAASVSETCSLTGGTEAACTLTVSLDVASVETSLVTTTAYSGDQYQLNLVTITGGLDMLSGAASATATATGTSATGGGSSASSSSSDSAASASASGDSDTSGARSNARAGDVMALIMIPSVAAVIGALFMLW